MKTGVELIDEERRRQIDVEGWTKEHDKQHEEGELANAGAYYALTDDMLTFIDKYWGNDMHLTIWQFDLESLKRNRRDGSLDNRIRELQKAGALIAAEIDRLLSVEMEAMSSVERMVVEIKQDRKKHPIKWMWKDFKWWLITSVNWVRIKLIKKQEKHGKNNRI